MPKTDLTVDLSGYSPVADRIQLFYQKYPAGRIVTELVSREGGQIVFKALIHREASSSEPAATGWAAEREGDGDINTVACLENAETSAIGRALANLGFTASLRRPSREEMYKAERARGRTVQYPPRSDALRVVRERQSDSLQQAANTAQDLLELITLCEQEGYPPRRTEILRNRVNTVPPLSLKRIERLESRLRHWLRVRQDWLP